MVKPFKSLFTSTSRADKTAHTPIVQGERFKQSGKVLQSEARLPQHDLSREGQEGDAVQGVEPPELPEAGKHVQADPTPPETAQYNLESDAGRRTVSSIEQTGRPQRKVLLSQEKRNHPATEPPCSSAAEALFQTECLDREEKDRILALMAADQENCKLFYEEQLEQLQTENKRLLDLQKCYEAQPKDIISIRDGEMRAKTGQLATTRRDIQQLWSPSNTFAELHQRYGVESQGPNSARDDTNPLYHNRTDQAPGEFRRVLEKDWEFGRVLAEPPHPPSLDENKDDIIATLNAQIEQLQRADAAKAEELVRAHADHEQLQRKLSASCSLTDELQKQQLDAIRMSPVVSEESWSPITEMKDYSTVVQLAASVDNWLREDGKRAEGLVHELGKRNKGNEELRRGLVLLKEIYIRAPELEEVFRSEIERRYGEQSRELKAALAEHQSKLDGVQRFVATADVYSDTIIILMLQKLNAEVQQNAVFIAECILDSLQPLPKTVTEEQTSATQRVSEYIGQTLADRLRGAESDELALWLSIAFQAYLTCHLSSIISSWTIEKGHNDFINSVYERLRTLESQAISGRWRSLTRTYILPTVISNPNLLIASTISGLSDIVVTAGCAISADDAKTKVSRFGDKVLSIIRLAGQFGEMTGEVVSSDFEVFGIRPDEPYEETTMEEDVDDYDEAANGTAAGQKVLCSTQLWLTKRIPLEFGEKETLTVMKAKVLLESFLDD